MINLAPAARGPRIRSFRAVAACALAWLGMTGAAGAAPDANLPPLRIVGGLAGVSQFTRHEEPFWTQDLARLSGGRLRAEIVPFDRAGIRGPDALSLVRQGSVPFSTVLLSVGAPRNPELSAMDLAGMNPDMTSLKRSVAAYRPTLEKLLRDDHGVELLALYVYPAQVLFCKDGWRNLDELKGRRIRTSSPTQADLVESLGAQPVATPFAEIATHLRSGHVDCAITGTMSGNVLGLHELSSHVHAMAINWGLSVFVANRAAWQALPEEHRALLRRELPRLEARIWDDADRETTEGIDCNVGRPGCKAGKPGHMKEVPATAVDRARLHELFAATVLPRWLERCGPTCEPLWNATLAGATGVPGGRTRQAAAR